MIFEFTIIFNIFIFNVQQFLYCRLSYSVSNKKIFYINITFYVKNCNMVKY